MAAPLTGKSWRDFLEKNKQLPPAFDREHAAQDVNTPICVSLKSVTGVVNKIDDSLGECQLSLSLYDSTYRQFFGRHWIGPGAYPKGARIQYNKSVYFHTSIHSANILVVVEVTTRSVSPSGQPQQLSCGWTFLRPFNSDGRTPDRPHAEKIQLYHGSPRALYFMDEPIEANKLLKPIESCELSYSVVTHKSLLQIVNLLPENTIVDANDTIPGVVDSSGSDKLKRARLQARVPIEIEGLVINLPPNADKFEEELIGLMRDDRSLRENKPRDALDVCIIERRLQVGVHNGWCYVEKPATFHLDKASGTSSKKPTSSPSMRRSSMRSNYLQQRRGSTGSSSNMSHAPTSLILKNKIQISDLLEDPMCAVVFTLEYVVGEPLTAQEKKKSMSLGRAHSRTVSVRWASWTPLLHPNTHEVRMALLGGALRAPDDSLVYRLNVDKMQDQAMAASAGGICEFRWAKAGEAIAPYSHSLTVPDYRGIGSAGSLRSDTQSEGLMFETGASAEARKPPHGKFRPGPGAAAASGGLDPTTMAAFPAMGSQMMAPQLTPAQQQLLSMAAMYPQMYSPQPMRMAEPSELQEHPFTPVHALSLAPGPLPKGGRGLSRAAYARLYAAGFPPLLDRNGDPPEVIDPQSHHLVNLTKEQADPLQANEVIFQFLAYTGEPSDQNSAAQGKTGHPVTVFFTFQFYRFPQVTTERMLLSKAQTDLSANPHAMPFILQRLNTDGSVMESPPGLEIKYPIDPTFLKPGEVSLFWQHLSRQTMHIDVWDGDSLLLIGSSSVELKYLFRGGNEAVQTTFELNVMSSPFENDESSTMTGDLSRGGSVRQTGQSQRQLGRLHFRLCNIGYPVERKKTMELQSVPSKTQVVVSHTAGNSSFKGGSLSAVIPSPGTKKVRVARAKNLVENREVASLLFSDTKKMEALSLGEEEVAPREGDAERQRKLSRLAAVKALEEKSDQKSATTIHGYRLEKSERTRDYKTMDIYRHQTKHAGILNMLNSSITTEHVLFPAFGSAEFFEFVLKNPFNKEETLTIEIDDPEMHLVSDTREWRHYKQLSQLTTPVEEAMFTTASSDKNRPQVFLRPKETVNIPLKFQTFKTDMTVKPQGPSNPFSKVNVQTEKDKSLEPRQIRVLFRSEEGKPVAVLNVRVEPQPHVIDQTFRFHHPENSFLKKSIRLPPFHTLPGAPVGGGGISQVFVRCSDPNVVLDCKPTQPGEPHDIFMKVALGASPQIKRFFVCAYIDPFLSRPTQIWQCYVHSLQRVDVSAVEGQTTRVSLLLKGTQATRLVKVFSSHPDELAVTPSDPFILAAGTVHEVTTAVRPLQPGNKFFYLNVVDVEYHQLVRTWLICTTCRSPIVSRAFELTLPVGGGKNNSKRITYTNPYPATKKFHLLCDRNDLLQFKEQVIEIEGGASHAIGLRFLPVTQPGSAEVMVFINDEEDKNEETFRVTATYKFF